MRAAGNDRKPQSHSAGCLLILLLLLAVGTNQARNISHGQKNPSSDAVPRELQAYVGVKTLVDKTTEELIADYPVLKGTSFSVHQEELPSLLEKIGERVEVFLQTISNTSSEETIHQVCNYERSRYRRESQQKFLYLISPRHDALNSELEEFRSDSKGESLEMKWIEKSSLVTSGFVSQSFIFHPRYRSSLAFRLLGKPLKNQNLWIIAFAQKPEHPSFTGGFQIGNQEIVLLLQGLAWFDDQTMQMVRLYTDLLAPREDVNLTRHTTEIFNSIVRFPPDSDLTLWLPKEVRVTIQWNGWRFFNRHHYTNYRLFSVETKDGQKQIVR